MKFVLILVFACGHGCGEPAELKISPAYASLADCDAAGEQWIAPAANPQGAIKTYECTDKR